jgi:hypothetical protein
MTALRSFETSGTDYNVTQCRIPEKRTIQLPVVKISKLEDDSILCFSKWQVKGCRTLSTVYIDFIQ